jgi:cytidylate kinase
MTEKLLVPSIEKRLERLIEISRRNVSGFSVRDRPKAGPTITISREYGCEGFPVSEKLQAMLQEKTGASWGVVDKALFEEVARTHDFPDDIFKNLGEKNRFLDDMMSTFSSRWKNEKDYYRLLCRQITAFAAGGNVIIVGRGAAILTQNMPTCYHFRIVAPLAFKVASIARRLQISEEEAEKLVQRKQKKRDAFIKDFLNRDVADLTLYQLIFNNARNTAEQIADLVCHSVLDR